MIYKNMSIKQDKSKVKSLNKLFRNSFKARQALNAKIVDKHFENLCQFAKEADEKIGGSVSVITPFGVIHYERRLVDMQFSFQRVGARKNKNKRK